MDDIIMNELIEIFIARGDLAHLALFLWASAASFAALFALRELAAASRRFDDFVSQLAQFNRRAARRRSVSRRDADDDARGDAAHGHARDDARDHDHS